jgi:hypothetical protein
MPPPTNPILFRAMNAPGNAAMGEKGQEFAAHVN